ncbi:MAG: JAB domain-containing protein [Evtepia sp.]
MLELLFYSPAARGCEPLPTSCWTPSVPWRGCWTPPDDLRKAPGVETRYLSSLIPPSPRYLASRTSAEVILSDSATLHALFTPYFFGARNEKSFLACFDSKGKLLGVRPLSEGTPNANEISLRKITTEALALNATVVVLAHNHPSGLATPSQEDLFLTRYIQDSLRPLGITLYDPRHPHR